MENTINLPEGDKLILRKLSNYFKSYGLKQAIIHIDSEWYNDISSYFTSADARLENSWEIGIPSFSTDLFEKLSSKIERSLKWNDIDIDSPNWDYVSIVINLDLQKIDAYREYAYEEPGDSRGLTWGDDTEDTELVERLVNEIRESGAKPNSDGIVVLDFNGSGDSGYIEGSFSNGGRVPANIENWCYEVLENNFGGWEINEGSQGYFNFDLTHRQIELEFTYNELTEKSNEIFDIDFGKTNK